MKESKRQKLEAQGWTVGDATTFLGLSREEVEYIEVKLALRQTTIERSPHDSDPTQEPL